MIIAQLARKMVAEEKESDTIWTRYSAVSAV